MHCSLFPWKQRNAARLVCFLLLASLIFSGTVPVVHAGIVDLAKQEDSWAILGGYGQSIPGWGETTQRVETVDLVPRYARTVIDDVGAGWLQGFCSLLLEVPVHLVVSPDTSSMIGMNFLVRYTFTAMGMRPYLFGGGGPVYNFADIPGMGADLNGNYQFGIGLEHGLTPDRSLLLELRYHHISNGGSDEPNEPLNSAKVLVGITF
ncbi:MAG: acyloxyacyl hydrolase [Desulfobulbaceae bacterium]